MANRQLGTANVEPQLRQPIVGGIIIRVKVPVRLSGVAQQIIDFRVRREVATARKADAIGLAGEPEALDRSLILIDQEGETR